MMWVRPTVLSIAAIAWVGMSFFADNLPLEFWKVNISKETLVNLFAILASTMLTVATFSVSAVAAAFGSVATSASPRATKIVMSDGSVQSTLAAFLAAFIYAVVSITALSALDFGAPGRFMLFVGFVLLVGWVLMSFLRWVDRVSRLGKLGDTLEHISEGAHIAFSDPDTVRFLGGRSRHDSTPPTDGALLYSDRFGYIEHLDMKGLQALAESMDGEIWFDIRPGILMIKNAPIGVIKSDKKPDDDQIAKLLKCIITNNDRNYKTDPRFAMILFAEVADRALSPAVNDPGTAISVLLFQLELFDLWAENDRKHANDVPKFDRIYIPKISAEDLVFDAFTPIARDGAAMIEVSIRLQKTLRALMNMNHEELQKAAAAYRETALELSTAAMTAESQRKTLEYLARKPL